MRKARFVVACLAIVCGAIGYETLFVTVTWCGGMVVQVVTFPVCRYLACLLERPSKTLTLKTTSRNQSTEESRSLVDRSSRGLRVWQWCETIRRPFMLGIHWSWTANLSRVRSNYWDVVNKKKWWCLLIYDWMMPSKQMSIWGIESAPRRAQWHSAAWPGIWALLFTRVFIWPDRFPGCCTPYLREPACNLMARGVTWIPRNTIFTYISCIKILV
jgi:hypothetical protein